MNIPRYWAKTQAHLRIGGQRTDYLSTFIGHSDRSDEEALQRARERVAAVQARIDNQSTGHAAECEVCIREEIVKELSSDAVVTRNRYGAEVLNCARLIMIDVDKPPAQGLWGARISARSKCASLIISVGPSAPWTNRSVTGSTRRTAAFG